MHFRRQTDGVVIIIYIWVSDINFFVSLCTRDRLIPKHDHLDYDAVFFLINFIYDSFFLLLQPKNRDLSLFFSLFFFCESAKCGQVSQTHPNKSSACGIEKSQVQTFQKTFDPLPARRYRCFTTSKLDLHW